MQQSGKGRCNSVFSYLLWDWLKNKERCYPCSPPNTVTTTCFIWWCFFYKLYFVFLSSLNFICCFCHWHTHILSWSTSPSTRHTLFAWAHIFLALVIWDLKKKTCYEFDHVDLPLSMHAGFHLCKVKIVHHSTSWACHYWKNASNDTFQLSFNLTSVNLQI